MKLSDQFTQILVSAQSLRPTLQDLEFDPVEKCQTPKWVLHERRTLLAAANKERAMQNMPPIDEETIVKKAERPAVGHSDYTRKFAFYAAELTQGRIPEYNH